MQFLYMLQEIRNPVLNIVFKLFTFMGEEYFIMLIFCWLAWCKDKRFAHRTGFAFCLGMGVNQVLKLIFCVQRPWILDSRIKPHPYAVEGATGYSFPSGHTQSSITVFGSLAMRFKNTVFRILCIFCAVMTGISRMYFGVHTPVDVFTSFLIGIAVIFVSGALYNLCEKHDTAALVLGVAVSLAMVAFALLKPYPPYHSAEYAYDCVKIAGAICGFITGWFLERRFVGYETDGTVRRGIFKTAVGIIILVILKIAFKNLFEQTYFIMYIQNFMLILWCIFLYPLLLKKSGV